MPGSEQLPRPQDDAAVPLEDKVRFLSNPSAYPDAPDVVTVKETHMSWVFMAKDRVFKLKKPVHYPYLDFSTLGARELYCREEVRLNRRLAEGVYLGVAPLLLSPAGDLTLDGPGQIVDWLVVMRRLPSERMLDVMLRRGSLSGSESLRLADVLSTFYRQAEHPPVVHDVPVDRFTNEMTTNRLVLTRQDLFSDQSAVKILLSRLDAALTRVRPSLIERARAGHIVEGHGDLRPEHICLTDPIVIFDCLEFDRELRLVDPFDEMASLSMECAYLGDPHFGAELIEHVARLSGETIPHDLIPLYVALHATLRARLSLAHLLDAAPREPTKWIPQTRRYLALASQALG
ncbi:hypothetical protein AB4072_13885 [Microvirga sp. 2MCAF38]|uniref:hypothetical protein n=1 Tax=Microvirga sp. 2MCAF38 TaxID=3232989 RepID=UPI003F9D9DFD